MVGFAVLGCGRIGKMHARNVALHPRARLVTVSEVLGMSDRIMVMHEGHVSGFLDRAEATQEKVMALAAK